MDILTQPKVLTLKWFKGTEEVMNLALPLHIPTLLTAVNDTEKQALELGADRVAVLLKVKDTTEGVSTDLPFCPEPLVVQTTGKTAITVDEMKEWLSVRVMDLKKFVMFMDDMLQQAMVFGPLKGVIITAILDNPANPEVSATGLGLLNTAYQLTDTDVKQLAERASAQVEEFKDKMRSAFKVEFPGDAKNNLILMPGQLPRRPIIGE